MGNTILSLSVLHETRASRSKQRRLGKGAVCAESGVRADPALSMPTPVASAAATSPIALPGALASSPEMAEDVWF